MCVNENSIQPTPSDFADFVYCGAKWVLDKVKSLNSIKKAKYFSYDNKKGNEKYNNLLLGQQNEYKCVEWTIEKYHVSTQQIVYNGTSKNNSRFLTSEIEPMGINMSCKPDLIISKDNRNILFEFKAVKDLIYVLLDEFDSVHAQVWCYTRLKEIKIHDYYILRYFIDPYKNLYDYKQLSTYELNTSKFERLFKQYIEAIEVLNGRDSKKETANMTLKMFNTPKEENEIRLKCHKCIYTRIGICMLESRYK